VAAAAAGELDDMEARSLPVPRRGWKASRPWTERLRERWSHFLLARLDPYITRWMSADPR
jgi:hypothetical protein